MFVIFFTAVILITLFEELIDHSLRPIKTSPGTHPACKFTNRWYENSLCLFVATHGDFWLSRHPNWCGKMVNSVGVIFRWPQIFSHPLRLSRSSPCTPSEGLPAPLSPFHQIQSRHLLDCSMREREARFQFADAMDWLPRFSSSTFLHGL